MTLRSSTAKITGGFEPLISMERWTYPHLTRFWSRH